MLLLASIYPDGPSPDFTPVIPESPGYRFVVFVLYMCETLRPSVFDAHPDSGDFSTVKEYPFQLIFLDIVVKIAHEDSPDRVCGPYDIIVGPAVASTVLIISLIVIAVVIFST